MATLRRRAIGWNSFIGACPHPKVAPKKLPHGRLQDPALGILPWQKLHRPLRARSHCENCSRSHNSTGGLLLATDGHAHPWSRTASIGRRSQRRPSSTAPTMHGRDSRDSPSHLCVPLIHVGGEHADVIRVAGVRIPCSFRAGAGCRPCRARSDFRGGRRLAVNSHCAASLVWATCLAPVSSVACVDCAGSLARNGPLGSCRPCRGSAASSFRNI
ncbi:hypothetical protein OBBRIDRAFT_380800 [Obba rivulosa]|uniref:Uncharacterized protein n=1 Tax=Obba rivulosa TaxID=1052685 RepID=A0A8E2B2W7_9APHY|nr:hypothetical protein OBBRIDRAFT_380800 [Obba rivulosa]